MKLLAANKAHIDSLSLEELLNHWRFAAIGDKWMEGETGVYWSKRMADLRAQPGGDDRYVAASKEIGWER